MILLLILILGVALVILLSRPQDSKPTDSVTKQASSTARSWADRAGEWLQSSSSESKTITFREYATGKGSKHFPADFKKWLKSLSDADAAQFTTALNDYSKGLGYNLAELVEGGLDDRPSLLNVFVEAIVIYSQEYRKARNAREEVDESEEEESKAADEKKPAQKRASRRKAGAEGAA